MEKIKKVIKEVNSQELSAVIEGWKLFYGEECQDKFIETFKTFYTEFLQNLGKQTEDESLKKQTQIAALMQEASQLETMLQQKIEVPANENLPLLCRFKVISSCLKKYREEAKDRKAEVAVLKAKELSLCKVLGEPSSSFGESNVLPSLEILEKFQEHLQHMELRKSKRTKQIQELQAAAIDLQRSLGITDPLLYNSSLKLHVKNITDLELIVKDLKDQNMRKLVDDTYCSLMQIWEELDMPEQKKKFESLDSNKKSLEILLAEKKRCEQLKEAKIRGLIAAKRAEIVEMMVKCRKSKDYMGKSIIHAEIEFNERFLKLHEETLETLTASYKQSSEVFKILDHRDSLKAELLNLTEQNDAKDRFKNRGGTLLKEEQAKKKLALTEVALSKAVKDYEAKHKLPFMVFDKPVQVDHTAVSRQELKRHVSCSELRLKPLRDLGNFQ